MNLFLQTVANGNGSVPGDVMSWLAGVFMTAAWHGDDEGCVKPQELSAKSRVTSSSYLHVTWLC
jgi:hypothetical protein